MGDCCARGREQRHNNYISHWFHWVHLEWEASVSSPHLNTEATTLTGMANNDISLIYLVRNPKISQIVSFGLECVTIIISYGESRPQLRSELKLMKPSLFTTSYTWHRNTQHAEYNYNQRWIWDNPYLHGFSAEQWRCLLSQRIRLPKQDLQRSLHENDIVHSQEVARSRSQWKTIDDGCPQRLNCGCNRDRNRTLKPSQWAFIPGRNRASKNNHRSIFNYQHINKDITLRIHVRIYFTCV